MKISFFFCLGMCNEKKVIHLRCSFIPRGGGLICGKAFIWYKKRKKRNVIIPISRIWKIQCHHGMIATVFSRQYYS